MKTHSATRLRGHIISYGPAGFGFISSDGVTYYFHQADIKPWSAPCEGLTVDFDARETEGKRPRAFNIKVIQ